MDLRYQLVAFDLYGTLLDISGLAAQMEGVAGATDLPGGAAVLLAAWRKAQLERTWKLNEQGAYEPFDVVTAKALTQVAPQLDADLRARLSSLWLTLPAYPDAKAALDRLRAGGVKTAVLSNGTEAMVKSALHAAGITVDFIRSADQVKAYKTDARVYALLDGLAPREKTLFVSSNGWDAGGARRGGRTVAFIERGLVPPALPPVLTVRSLAALADALEERRA